MIFDADGLKLLARIPDWHKLLPAPVILTPHPGEMSVLTGLSKEEIQANGRRLPAGMQKNGTCGDSQRCVYYHRRARRPPDDHPGCFACVGARRTGDVLAGLIVGLRAQGLEAFEAAVAGAWIHAQAVSTPRTISVRPPPCWLATYWILFQMS